VSRNANDLKLEEIKNQLISEEKRRNERKTVHQDSEVDQVFYQNERGKDWFVKKKSSVCFNCNKAGHIAPKCKFPKNKCSNCNKFGHLSPHCRMPKTNREKNASVNAVKASFQKEFVFHTNIKDADTTNVWLLDSGSTNHICCSKEVFTSMRSHRSIIKVGDGRELQVTGIGQVELQTEKAKIKINDVLYVPNMKKNLLSIGKLTKKGASIVFEQNRCKIMKGQELVADTVPLTQNNSLYQLKVVNSSSASTRKEDNAKIDTDKKKKKSSDVCLKEKVDNDDNDDGSDSKVKSRKEEKENPVKTEIGAHTNQVRQSTREKSKTKFDKPEQATTTKASTNEQIGFIHCLYEKEKPRVFKKVLRTSLKTREKKSEFVEMHQRRWQRTF
jgi:hypothetical protein